MGTYKNIWIERVSGFVQGRVAVELSKNWASIVTLRVNVKRQTSLKKTKLKLK